jgi:hypothetical protein
METNRTAVRFRAGDIAVVRDAEEIFLTLDSDGALDGLPFMPEMLEFCGKTFRVLNRVVQATMDGAFLKQHTESFVREFRNNDVVTLSGVRCPGVDHDGCQRGCAIFWKEAWLKKVEDVDDACMAHREPITAGSVQAYSLLKTRTAGGNYFCQSSEFLKATRHLSGARRVQNCLSAVAARNISALGMVKRVLVWMWWKSYAKVIGQHARGRQTNTPSETLNLQPGDFVEVKPIQEIVTTLNKNGRNRGLHFSADQRPFCGGRYQVRSRADNFIAEGTGEMKHFRDTVILEDVCCDSSCFAFGGCYRSDLLYWREIWLRKVEPLPHSSCAGRNPGGAIPKPALR